MRGLAGQALRLLRRAPFTAAVVTAILVLAVAGASDEVLGLSASDLRDGLWWTPFTSMFLAGGPWSYVVSLLLVGVLCGVAEHRIGTARTATVFLLSHVIGALVATAVVSVGASSGDWWFTDVSEQVMTSPSGAAFAVGLAASSRLAPTWRRRLRLVLVLTMVMLFLYLGGMADLVRLSAGATGLVLGRLLLGPAEHGRDDTPSRVETRLLVAVIVAACAVGPLVLAASPAASGGPWAFLQALMVGYQVDATDVEMACGAPVNELACQQARAALRMSGFGPAILSIVPALLMLVTAEGLRRGRRFAWWSAVTLNVALAGLGVLLLVTLLGEFDEFTATDWVMLSGPIQQPVLILALLFATRRGFDVRAPSGVYPRFVAKAAATLAICSAIYLVGVWLLRDEFEQRPTFGQILADLPNQFLPPGYLIGLDMTTFPTGGAAILLEQWIGVVFWLVVLATWVATFWRAEVRSLDADRGRARDLLATHGGGTMSHMITWRGNHYWFARDGRAVIGYRVISGVALTTGEPAGAPDAAGSAAREFALFCAANGWTPCFYGVGAGLRDELSGWSSLQVAEDIVLPLAGLEFKGKKWQDVRTAMNKAKNLGITAAWSTYAELPDGTREQIRSLSRAWLTDKGLPEMGFTLGGLEELADPEVRCLVAVDDEQRVHAVTSWLPVRRDGVTVGWTLDFMRRGNDSFPGVMEFLIASMVVRSAADGVEAISLSGAPLARLDRDMPTPVAQRLLDVVGRTLEPVYGFRSLLAFKAKFQPTYLPLYMSYPDAAALPSIGNAITKAYVPTITVKQGTRLVGKLVKRR